MPQLPTAQVWISDELSSSRVAREAKTPPERHARNGSDLAAIEFRQRLLVRPHRAERRPRFRLSQERCKGSRRAYTGGAPDDTWTISLARARRAELLPVLFSPTKSVSGWSKLIVSLTYERNSVIRKLAIRIAHH